VEPGGAYAVNALRFAVSRSLKRSSSWCCPASHMIESLPQPQLLQNSGRRSLQQLLRHFSQQIQSY
jgi:hypothetical protein